MSTNPTTKANASSISPRDVDVLLLCGGLGTRLREVVSDRPKPMAEVGGRPFLDILIEHCVKFGFRSFILCAGHKASFIQDYYAKYDQGLDISVSVEPTALGTAGAIKNAQGLIKSDPFIVMNGDSFCAVALDDLLRFYNQKNAEVLVALSEVEERSEYGSVRLTPDKRVLSFDEKVNSSESGLINTGVYVFSSSVLDLIAPAQKVSLEDDIFPNILGREFFGYITGRRHIDIGTPQRLESAKRNL